MTSKIEAYEKEFKIAVVIDENHGRYWVSEFDEADKIKGIKPVMVSKQWLHDYRLHCAVDSLWQNTLSQLNIKQHKLNHPEESKK